MEKLEEVKNSLDKEQLGLFDAQITEAENRILFNQETQQ